MWSVQLTDAGRYSPAGADGALCAMSSGSRPARPKPDHPHRRRQRRARRPTHRVARRSGAHAPIRAWRARVGKGTISRWGPGRPSRSGSAATGKRPIGRDIVYIDVRIHRCNSAITHDRTSSGASRRRPGAQRPVTSFVSKFGPLIAADRAKIALVGHLDDGDRGRFAQDRNRGHSPASTSRR
jgi:hypothetical protein